MTRLIPEGRFSRLVDVATRTFVARGYRLTQMADVADALGVAKGTVYGYVASKEALFDTAVRYADDPDPRPPELPLPTPAAGSTVGYVRTRLVAEAGDMELVKALSLPKGARVAPDELARIIRDLFRRMARNRRALKLVDRCAIDHPELASVWFDEGRRAQVGLIASYLEKRVAQGRLRRVPDVRLAARMLLETIASWAIHMPWDPAPGPFSDDAVEDAVVDLLVHAYTKEGKR